MKNSASATTLLLDVYITESGSQHLSLRECEKVQLVAPPRPDTQYAVFITVDRCVP